MGGGGDTGINVSSPTSVLDVHPTQPNGAARTKADSDELEAVNAYWYTRSDGGAGTLEQGDGPQEVPDCPMVACELLPPPHVIARDHKRSLHHHSHRARDYLGRKLPRHVDTTKLHAPALYTRQGSLIYRSNSARFGTAEEHASLGVQRSVNVHLMAKERMPCIGMYDAHRHCRGGFFSVRNTMIEKTSQPTVACGYMPGNIAFFRAQSAGQPRPTSSTPANALPW